LEGIDRIAKLVISKERIEVRRIGDPLLCGLEKQVRILSGKIKVQEQIQQ